MKNKWAMKRLWLWIGIIIACICVYLWLHGKKDGDTGEPSAVVAVETADITKKTLTDSIETYGLVNADNAGVINITIPRTAIIANLAVVLGQRISKGDVLLELHSDPEGDVAYTQATTSLQLARSERARTKQLVSEQLATDSQLAAADKALHDAEAALDAQKKLGNGIALQKITAPFNGIVSSISAAQGDKTAPGTPVMQLSSNSGLRVELSIEPQDREKVKPGMQVIASPLFDKTIHAEGKITQVQGMIDPKSQMVTAFATFNKDAGKLLPGSSVHAAIILATKESMAVPAQAILSDDKGSYLFQVNGEKAQRVDVTTGLESDGFIAIEGQFDPAKKVVLSGNYELQDGMALREEKAEPEKATP